MREISITKRDNKGAALTWPEMDANWREVERQLKGLAIPAHPSLTNGDIGKLLILKNGVAKLPEFEPLAIGNRVNVGVSFTGDFVPLQRPTLTITFTDQLVENDFVEISMRTLSGNVLMTEVFTAVEADDSATEFIIGATKEDTMANLKVKVEAWMLANNIHPCFAIDDTTAANVCRVVADTWGQTQATNFWGDTSTNQTYITIDRTGDAIEDREGSVLLMLLLLEGLAYTYDGDARQYNTGNQALNNLLTYDGSILTESTYVSFTEATVKFPANAQQLMEYVGHAMTGIYEGYISYSRSGSNLTMVFSSVCADFSINLDSPDDDVYGDNFTDVTESEGAAETIPVCNYPLLGQMAGLHNGSAIISQDQIGKFLVTGEIGVSNNVAPVNGFISLSRFCCLNPDSPGHIMSAINYGAINPAALNSLGKIIAPGFVSAFEDGEDGDQIIGEFKREMFIVFLGSQE